MYQFSRAIYRELSPLIDSTPGARDGHAEVLRACETTIERLATDRHYFAKPARTLFNDICRAPAAGALQIIPPGTSKWNKIEHRLFSRIT